MPTQIVHNMTFGRAQPQIVELTKRHGYRVKQALKLYGEIVVSEAQHSPSELKYWHHRQEQFADKFELYAIQSDKRIEGFFESSYFSKEHIIFIRSLCIRKTMAGNDLDYTETLELIRDYLTQCYSAKELLIVFEVPWTKLSADNWQPDANLISCFELVGFRKIGLEYKCPAVQPSDGEKAFPADLLSFRPRGKSRLSLYEIRLILRTVYFNYYLRWDSPFLAPELFERRAGFLHGLHNTVELQMRENKSLVKPDSNNSSEIAKLSKSRPWLTRMIDWLAEKDLARFSVISLLLLPSSIILDRPERFLAHVLGMVLIFQTMRDGDRSKNLAKTIMSCFGLRLL
jgi:hypothetical protein